MIGSAPWALLMVMIGLLELVGPPHQAGVSVGGDAALTLTAISPPVVPFGQPWSWLPRNTKYVPVEVVNKAAAWMIALPAFGLPETRTFASGMALTPPRFARLMR